MTSHPENHSADTTIPSLLQRELLHPRYWGIWLGYGFMVLITSLPHSWQMKIGALLGFFAWHLARGRRNVVSVNLDLCFPALTGAERTELARENFRNTGISLIETARAWIHSPASARNRVSIHGLEHLLAARDQGKGVILLGMHLSTLDYCGAVLSTQVGFDVMYRKNNNALMETIMTRGRMRNYPHAIHRDDVRAVIKNLKSGHVVWYGPDQDYGRRHSVFAPFFGIEAATVTATSRIARISGAPIIVFSHFRRPDDQHYDIYLSPLSDAYPSGDATLDAVTINQVIEQEILREPAQYWWLHRRFKTRPEGKTRPYKPRKPKQRQSS